MPPMAFHGFSVNRCPNPRQPPIRLIGKVGSVGYRKLKPLRIAIDAAIPKPSHVIRCENSDFVFVGDVERDLCDWIGEAFAFYPLFPQDDVDAQHHEDKNRHESRPR